MGDRYIITVVCPNCDTESEDVPFAPTCGFVDFTCPECGLVIDLEEYTGISYEEASNRAEIEAIIGTMEYQNGTLWEADWPYCHTALLQVLPGANFCLLSYTGRASHGGTCLNVITDENGKWQYTVEELGERLKGWSLLPNHKLKVSYY
jgi:hypothetical protein